MNAIAACLETFAANPRVKIGIITFDSAVHFYNLLSPKGDPEMMIITDLENVFVPIPSKCLCVNISDEKSRETLISLLHLLPEMFANNDKNESCFGSACQAALCALELTGGKVILIQSSMPTTGLGKLTFRDDVNLYGTDKKRQLFMPQTSFYKVLATKFAENSITVDLFVCANSYVDLATIGVLCKTTGGQIFYYPGFNYCKDGEAIYFDVYHDISRNIGFDGVMIVRCSSGLKVADQYGHFFIRTAHEMELPTIDCDKTFAVRLEHEDVLEDRSEACIQVALLYTTYAGERRIRVHTISPTVTSVMGNIFRQSDLDAIINLSLKQAVYDLPSIPFRASRIGLVQACIDMLYTYRKFCAHASSRGQLILPESLKLLPLYTLGLIKNQLLSDNLRSDERCFLLSYCITMPCSLSVPFIYPHLYSLHDLESNDCVLTESNRVSIPQCRQLTSKEISSSGLYLLDNGRHLFLSVGNDLDRTIVEQVFGLPQDEPMVDSSSLILSETVENDQFHMASRVRLLIDELRADKPNYSPLTIMEKCIKRGNSVNRNSLDKTAFLGYLIEDDPLKSTKGSKSPHHMSYVDFLCHIHRQIQDKFM